MVSALLGLWVALGAAAGEVETIDLPEYRLRLAGIARALGAGETAAARVAAERLARSRVATPSGTIAADRSLLAPLLEPGDGAGAGALAARIDRVVGVLGEAAANDAAAPDRAALEALARDEAVVLPEPGGGAHPVAANPAWERLGKAIARAARWVGEKLYRFFDWLVGLWRRDPPEAARGRPASVRAVTAVLVALVLGLVLLLAFRARRRAGGEVAEEVRSEAAAATAADADPLSREAAEWLRYARELERRGRLREAIRAWFHAALVTLLRDGALHHRTGATNWEYVLSLDPARAVRGRLAELTRTFEREWYGGERSTPETLEQVEALSQGVIALCRAEQGAR
jgi:hypothetical protein